MKTVERKQTVANALGWRVCQTVCFVFATVLVLRNVIVSQKYFFVFGCYWVDLTGGRETILSILTETVVFRVFLANSGIECTDSRSNLVIVIFHIVTEHHNLCDVQETAILRIDKALLHAVGLRLYTFVVVFFLNLNESQWQTVYKDGNIWAVVVAVLTTTSHFRGNLECIVPIEIDR